MPRNFGPVIPLHGVADRASRGTQLREQAKRLTYVLKKEVFVNHSMQVECDRRIWPSYKGRMVDALAPEADEGRGKLR